MKIINVFATIFPLFMLVANADHNSATVGQSFYLPEKDILSPLVGGVHIFRKLDDSCFKWKEQQLIVDDRSAYETTESFYRQISSESGISVKLMGMFTMGATLNMKTKSMSSGTTNIKGESINIGNYVNSTYLDQDCFKASTSELSDDLLSMFDNLPLPIQNPWLGESWQRYDTFLRTFGSHFVTIVKYGVMVRQWTFSKSESNYDFNQLNIRACVEIAGPTEVGILEIDACSGVTKADAKAVVDLKTSDYLEINGGTDATKVKFRSSRSQKDLNKLLNEGREMQSPTSYEYIAIWDILMMKFYDNPSRYAKAMNLMHYYRGYLDFGCTYQSSGNQKLRAFDYSKLESTPTMPVFQCILINEGCQENKDCHAYLFTCTYCYGSSCYEYKQPEIGYKAMSVSARNNELGHYDKGINRSCYFDWFGGDCHKNFFDKKVIWNGNAIAHKAKLKQAMLEFKVPASQNLEHSKL